MAKSACLLVLAIACVASVNGGKRSVIRGCTCYLSNYFTRLRIPILPSSEFYYSNPYKNNRNQLAAVMYSVACRSHAAIYRTLSGLPVLFPFA